MILCVCACVYIHSQRKILKIITLQKNNCMGFVCFSLALCIHLLSLILFLKYPQIMHSNYAINFTHKLSLIRFSSD